MTTIAAFDWNAFLKELYPIPPYTPEQLARFAEQRAARLELERHGERCHVPEHEDNTGSRCRYAGRDVLVEDFRDHDCCSACNDWADTLPRNRMRTPEQQAEFERLSSYGTRPYHVHDCTEDHLILVGGGDFYDHGEVPDEETQAEARKIAESVGKVIIDGHGEWRGWSEYTPDPGDVSVFTWRDA